MFVQESTLLAVERQKLIRDILEKEGVVRTAELKEILQVSSVTIRADLRELEAVGLCKVIWGGAVYVQPIDETDPLTLSERTKLNRDAKIRIGLRAAQLIEVGQTVFVDAGSTAIELVRHLPKDMDYLRIVTPALNVALAALQMPQIEVFMTGGIVRNLTQSLIGPQAMRTLEMFNADWAFIATGGFSASHGVTTSNTLEVEVKRTMIEMASRVALLADSSKMDRVLSLNVAPFSEIDVLVTDSGLPPEYAATLEQQGVEVYRV